MRNLILLLVLLAGLVYADVAVTIYNNNLALVRETRDIEFTKGIQHIKYVDVASQIEPTSVHFKAVNSPVQLLEQNYEYDLVGTASLLQKYIEEELRVTTENEVYSGKLLSTGNDIILQTDEGQIRAVKADAVQTIEFPSLPEGLISRPTLVWMINSPNAGKQNTELSYLTRGMAWHAEYVAVVNADDTKLDLAGWVSINNNAGLTFKDAKIKLVAGDVNMVQETRMRKSFMQADMAMAAAPEQFQEKEFFEYHLYTLQRPATIKDNQMKQISLFNPQTANVKKLFVYDGDRNQNKVQVQLEFKNSEHNNLGMPLPKGKVRVYKTDSDGSQEFIGEDQIDHTPKDEIVRLTMGNAFDVVGERTVISTRRINDNTREQKIQIVLRNHKKENIAVKVVEHFWGNWRIVGTGPNFTKKTATLGEFEVLVPKDDEAKAEFTVLITN